MTPLTRDGLVLPLQPSPGLHPRIHPRADWAQDTCPPGKGLRTEESPKFLLVHHSETPAPGRAAQVVGQLRSFYRFHTTTKGWPDVAYNFLVDPFGGLWEGRAGSLDRPIRGDATGGSQGHAELVCFLGSFSQSPPTKAALDAAAELLAWLAVRDGIDLFAKKSITFTSRGSNKWPQGSLVTTWPIAGHREMSQTSCPGDALYPLVRKRLLPQAQRIVGAPTPAPTPRPSLSSAPSPGAATPTAAAPAGAQGPIAFALPLGVGLGAAGLLTVGAWYVSRRRGGAASTEPRRATRDP